MIRRSRPASLVATLAFGVLLTACVAPFPDPVVDGEDVRSEVLADGAVVLVHTGEPAAVVAAIDAGITAALAACAPWGRFETPVRLLVYPDAPSFRRAVGRDYPWLRAWANEREIALLSPRAWPRAARFRLPRLVTHETVHVLHYQAAGLAASQSRSNDPFWFREGLASVLAGDVRAPVAHVLRVLEREPDLDLLDPDRDTLTKRSRDLYAAAHHLVAWLIAERPGGVATTLKALREGEAFPQAALRGFGGPPRELLAAWRAHARGS